MLAALALLCAACAEVVQPSEDFWYLDEADVLSDATEGEIFFANQRLYDACGAEIVVVAINSTGNMAIDDYAYTLFNEWEIGGNSYRGLLLLMAIEDDNYYAMPGTNMGQYFDSATLRDMLNTYLEPDFAEKNYDQGARLFFEAAYEKTVDDLNLNLSIADAKADYEAFLREESVSEQQSTVVVSEKPYDSAQMIHMERRLRNVSVVPVLIVMLMALLIVSRSFRGHARHSTYRRNSSVMTGFMLGRMTSARRRYYRGPMHVGPHMGHRPPMSGPGNMHRSSGPSSGSFGGRSSGRSSGGFGGASRSSFGGSSRSGGFGGASRSGGGASRGPSTRGGGSGRFSR